MITLLAGLAVRFGVRRFASCTLLNVWFVIAVTLPDAYRHIHTSAWPQTLAWLAGSALMIAFTTIVWLARGRKAQPTSGILPGDTTPMQLTRPVILFAVLRAVAVARRSSGMAGRCTE